MRIVPWQIVFGFGLMLILIKLLLALLLPVGIALVVLGLILFFVQGASKPRVIKG